MDCVSRGHFKGHARPLARWCYSEVFCGECTACWQWACLLKTALGLGTQQGFPASHLDPIAPTSVWGWVPSCCWGDMSGDLLSCPLADAPAPLLSFAGHFQGKVSLALWSILPGSKWAPVFFTMEMIRQRHLCTLALTLLSSAGTVLLYSQGPCSPCPLWAGRTFSMLLYPLVLNETPSSPILCVCPGLQWCGAAQLRHIVIPNSSISCPHGCILREVGVSRAQLSNILAVPHPNPEESKILVYLWRLHGPPWASCSSVYLPQQSPTQAERSLQMYNGFLSY